MSEQLRSHHPHHKNIHHGEGCRTAEGKMCSACCQYFEVKPLQKVARAACDHMTAGGCAIHNSDAQPTLCRAYHCSNETDILRNPLISDQVIRQIAFERVMGLLQTARELQQLSSEECMTAAQYWRHLLEQVYCFDGEE